MFTKEAQKLAKACYEAIKKISKGKWEWELEWLDPLLFTYGKYSGVYWFKCSDVSERFKGWIFILTKGIEEAALHVPQESCIPLLHWERIEEILEGMGYDLIIKDFWVDIERTEKFYSCHISKGYENGMLNVLAGGDYETCKEPKTRQEAVMLAVIELGKEE